MSSPHAPKPRVHHLVQAPVKPLDEDGIVVGIIGTVGWLIAVAILWLNLGNWPDIDLTRWLWTSAAGAGLGIFGTGYCYLRKLRRKRGNWTRN